MHGLDTIIALNERATERCEDCQQARITIESRATGHDRDFLAEYTVDGRLRLLCRPCVAWRVDRRDGWDGSDLGESKPEVVCAYGQGNVLTGRDQFNPDHYRKVRRENEVA